MTDSAITRLWGRIPLVVRAILLGLAVSTLGVGAWVACQMVIPSPWWLLVMSGLLWAYWRYFSGSWWPASTVEYRRASFRETRLPVAVWRLGLGAAASFVVARAVGDGARRDRVGGVSWTRDAFGVLHHRGICIAEQRTPLPSAP